MCHENSNKDQNIEFMAFSPVYVCVICSYLLGHCPLFTLYLLMLPFVPKSLLFCSLSSFSHTHIHLSTNFTYNYIFLSIISPLSCPSLFPPFRPFSLLTQTPCFMTFSYILKSRVNIWEKIPGICPSEPGLFHLTWTPVPYTSLLMTSLHSSLQQKNVLCICAVHVCISFYSPYPLMGI